MASTARLLGHQLRRIDQRGGTLKRVTPTSLVGCVSSACAASERLSAGLAGVFLCVRTAGAIWLPATVLPNTLVLAVGSQWRDSRVSLFRKVLHYVYFPISTLDLKENASYMVVIHSRLVLLDFLRHTLHLL